MTRYARGNKGNRKRPHEATSWADLQSRSNGQSPQPTTFTANEDNASESKSKTKNRRKLKERKIETLQSDGKHTLKTPGSLHGVICQDSSSEDLLTGLSQRLAPLNEDRQGGNRNKTLGAEKKTRRSEERRLKRIKNKANKMVCYHCREAGHGVADCPKMLRDEEQGTGICFRCGSTEHEANKCTAKVDTTKGDYPFAKCFICQEIGHLSRSCPDNPRGLYPLGGGCKHCGSVEHRNQHCPHSIEASKDWKDPTLPSLSSTLSWSADAEIDDVKPTVLRTQSTKKTPKVVYF